MISAAGCSNYEGVKFEEEIINAILFTYVFECGDATRAASTVDRIVDVFPAHQQGQIRTQLAGNIEGVVSQTLVASADGSRRYGAMEIMLGTPSIRNLIRESKSHQIQNILQTGAAAGMMTLEASLRQLVLAGKISVEEAQAE